MVDEITPDPVTEAPAEKPVAKFVTGPRPREKSIPLEWPIEYDGVIYEEVTVRRCTGLEISEFLMEQSQSGRSIFPGISCPLAVYDQLDADDLAAVDEVVRDFLPRSFRQLDASTPEVSGKS